MLYLKLFKIKLREEGYIFMKKLLSIMLTCLLSFQCSVNVMAKDKTESVEDYEYTLTWYNYNDDKVLEAVERDGLYTGKLKNGKPEGEGTFECPSRHYTFKGTFKNGLANGYGEMHFEATDERDAYVEYGDYKKGAYSPTPSQLLTSEASFFTASGEFAFSVSGDSIDFIDEHENYFISEKKKDNEYADLINSEIDYAQLQKNVNAYDGELATFSGYTIFTKFEVFEFGYDISRIIAIDANNNYFLIFYLGNIDKNEGDTIDFVLLPIDDSQATDTNGGRLPVMIGLATEIQ